MLCAVRNTACLLLQEESHRAARWRLIQKIEPEFEDCKAITKTGMPPKETEHKSYALEWVDHVPAGAVKGPIYLGPKGFNGFRKNARGKRGHPRQKILAKIEDVDAGEVRKRGYGGDASGDGKWGGYLGTWEGPQRRSLDKALVLGHFLP